jgi:hypothetical protein
MICGLYAYLGLSNPLTLLSFRFLFCGNSSLCELECITRNLPDVAFNVFNRLKNYLIRLAFLTVYIFIVETGTQIKFLKIVMQLQRLDV